MLPPPRRYKRRRWHCATCGAELGRLRTSIGGGRTLYATELVSARKIGPRTWMLTCNHKDAHETEWTGDQLNWWEVPQAA